MNHHNNNLSKYQYIFVAKITKLLLVISLIATLTGNLNIANGQVTTNNIYGNTNTILELLNVSEVGKVYKGTKLSYKVKATQSGMVSKVRLFLGKLGDAPATTVSVQTDKNGSPSGEIVSQSNIVYTAGYDRWETIDVPDFAIASDDTYHIVLSTSGGDSSNYLRVLYSRPRNSENDLLSTIDGGVTWKRFNPDVKKGEPIFLFEYTDGVLKGNPYTVSNSDVNQIYGNHYVGELFTPTENLTLSQISIPIYMSHTSGETLNVAEDALYVRLETESGELIEEGQIIKVSEFNTLDSDTSPKWLTYNFKNLVSLSEEQTYRIYLKSPGTTAANAYNIAPMTTASGNAEATFGGTTDVLSYTTDGTSWQTSTASDIGFKFTKGYYLRNLHPEIHARLGIKMLINAVGNPQDKVKISLIGPSGAQRVWLSEESLSSETNTVKMELRSLASGNYTLKTQIINSQNQVVEEISERFEKPYNGVPHVGIDENNGIFVDGQPTFFVTTWISGVNQGQFYDVDDWQAAGYVNTSNGDTVFGNINGYSSGQLGHWLAHLDSLQGIGAHGIGPMAFDAETASDSEILSWVNETKDHPAFRIYNWRDEPDYNGIGASEVKRWTDISRNDPQHPVLVNLVGYSWVGTNFYQNLMKTYSLDRLSDNQKLIADIYSFDYYPEFQYRGRGTKQDAYDRLANISKNMRDWTYDLAPRAAWVEVCDINNIQDGLNMPTGQEVWAQVWIDIIHGAKIIQWFHYFGSYDPTVFPYMKKTVDYTSHFAPQIMSGDSEKITKFQNTGTGRIDYMTKEYDGKLYLFAVNRDITTAATATFAISDFEAGTVSAYDEDRTLAVSNNSFQDSFEPMAVHIYEITAPSAPQPSDGSPYYWTWYDEQSTGFKNWVLMANPVGATNLLFDLSIAGDSYLGDGVVQGGNTLTTSYPGVMGGPVMATSRTGQKGILSQRILMGNSFEEVLGAEQLSHRYYWAWYDQQSPGFKNWVLLINPDSAAESAHYTLSVGGEVVDTGVLDPGERVTPTFSGKMGGPVEVVACSTAALDQYRECAGNPVNVIASQRVVSNFGVAFNEAPGIPAERLSHRYYWTWYDQQSSGFNNWVLLANPESAAESAYYTLSVGGEVVDTGVLDPGERATPSFPGRMGGPLEVVSCSTAVLDQNHECVANPVNVIATQRIMAGPSFGEIPGYPAGDLSNNYHWTWYDQQSPASKNWVLIANPSGAPVNYWVDINGMEMPISSSNPGVIQPFGMVTATFPGIMNGPVEVTAHGPVMVSQRVLWNGHFNEVPGTVLD